MRFRVILALPIAIAAAAIVVGRTCSDPHAVDRMGAPLLLSLAAPDSGVDAATEALPLFPLEPAPAARSVRVSVRDLVPGPGTSVAARCAELARSQRALFDAVVASWSGDGGRTCMPELPKPSGSCVVHGNQAWGVVLEAVDIEWADRYVDMKSSVGACPWRGHLAIVHMGDAEAQDGVWRPWPPVDVTESIRLGVRSPFDFDGDGSDEIAVELVVHDGNVRYAWNGLVTAKGGELALYAPAERWRVAPNARTCTVDLAACKDPVRELELRDVDHDGRPDLVLRRFMGRETDDIFDRYFRGFDVDPLDGLAFLAHSNRAGDFATDDNAAHAFARAACPSPPRTLDAWRDRQLDVRATARNAICARAWGMAQADLDKAIAGACGVGGRGASCEKVVAALSDGPLPIGLAPP